MNESRPTRAATGQRTLSFDPGPSDTPTAREKPLERLFCARPGCGQDVPPQERGGDPKRYCSEDCQKRHYRDTHVSVPIENPDKATRRSRVYARLRAGRATGLELLRAGGGMRPAARVHELRALRLRILGPQKWKRPDGTVEEETLPLTEDGWPQYELRQE